MSHGFHKHDAFSLVGAVDAERAKPSGGDGTLGCNATYELNNGIAPLDRDIADLAPEELAALLSVNQGELDVLLACPPCTGLSRANPNNHLYDDPRNSLIVHVAHFVDYFRPKVLVMENAREMLRGNFSHHFSELRLRLEQLGYSVHADIYMLDRFGLPQRRERALVLATAPGVQHRTLDDVWSKLQVRREATTVRRAISTLPAVRAGAITDDGAHRAPSLGELNAARIAAVPSDGGSWIDLMAKDESRALMTPGMEKNIRTGKLGSYPDVYGRMSWDRPAPTIKRECSHIGNGRYAHPEQDRLCTLREMALLNGFPRTYEFANVSLSNQYRHVGDAVPPLISFQLAVVANWCLSGAEPNPVDLVLSGTSLELEDVVQVDTAERETQGLLELTRASG